MGFYIKINWKSWFGQPNRSSHDRSNQNPDKSIYVFLLRKIKMKSFLLLILLEIMLFWIDVIMNLARLDNHAKTDESSSSDGKSIPFSP